MTPNPGTRASHANGTLPPRSAVALVSGGLDSATVLAEAVTAGFSVFAISVNYGQRHRAELDAARAVAQALGAADHLTMDLDLRQFGGSALTDDIAVPKHEAADRIGTGIPVTYVPARNTIFLSLALAWAEVLHAEDIFIGVNVVDYSGYPDCRPEFIEAFERMANLATRASTEGTARVRIHTPLISLTKAQIIQRATDLGVDLSLTVSCYDPDASGAACGHCDACLLRRRGFSEAGIPDVTRYRPAD